MGLKITQETVDAFTVYCHELIEQQADEECKGAWLSITGCDIFTEKWEFHADNYKPDNTYNIHELFELVADKLSIEEHGYDEFFITKLVPTPVLLTEPEAKKIWLALANYGDNMDAGPARNNIKALMEKIAVSGNVTTQEKIDWSWLQY